jgi:hypothetical protein
MEAGEMRGHEFFEYQRMLHEMRLLKFITEVESY